MLCYMVCYVLLYHIFTKIHIYIFYSFLIFLLLNIIYKYYLVLNDLNRKYAQINFGKVRHSVETNTVWLYVVGNTDAGISDMCETTSSSDLCGIWFDRDRNWDLTDMSSLTM